MNVQETIDYINSFTWSKTRLGLERTRTLLEKLGDPQKKLKFIHVAGTNGKGSTCAMLASVLKCAGYRTGLFTSPHIVRFNERIQVNGVEITDEELAEAADSVIKAADSMDDHPSQFELVTAIGMVYFLHRQCDIVVVEVGMGGDMDSTNVIDAPECSVICNIGLDHTEYLGDTLEKIAATKAGIIKPDCPVVCYRGTAEVEAVFERIASEKRSPLYMADFEAIRPISGSLSGQVFSWHELDCLSLPLIGAHQLKNAAVVLETLKVLNDNGWNISEQSIRSGLASTKWPVRFEVLRQSPPVIVDGAHNPQCAEALASALEKYLPGKQSVFLMGVLADKDYAKILGILRPYAKRFVCITPDSPRALGANELAEYLRGLGEDAESCGSIGEGVIRALSDGCPVVACGSLYMAGIAAGLFRRMIDK
ncbi:MAG: folylpolyglutamate synthase/dihydrofolate synthase family protein [Eubacteriales bacterium]|nr:folylpolyglutamate synthase/dihydrofolate synthase family protein [Eubacteriales bacterium]